MKHEKIEEHRIERTDRREHYDPPVKNIRAGRHFGRLIVPLSVPLSTANYKKT